MTDIESGIPVVIEEEKSLLYRLICLFNPINITNNGTTAWTFSGPGIVAGNTDDPVLYLYKAHTYTFTNNAGSSFPFQIRTSNGGAAYTNGVSGSSTGTTTFVVPMNAPGTLYYQCTAQAAMGNTIFIV